MEDRETRNGVPLLPKRPGAVPTHPELVKGLDEELSSAMRTLTIRVDLPAHLRVLARIPTHEVCVEVAEPLTVRRVLDALEALYPALRGTIRDYGTGERRAYMRLFACQLDISLDSVDAELPAAVVSGKEPLIILGAVAGG